MSFYRSQSLTHYNLIIPRYNAQQILHNLGQYNLIHIIPLNAPLMQRPYIHQVKRCNDLLLKLHEIQNILGQKNVLVKRLEFTMVQYQGIFQQWKKLREQNTLNSINVLDKIDHWIQDTWHIFKNYVKRVQQLRIKDMFLKDNLAIIKAGVHQFGIDFFTNNNRHWDQFQGQFSIRDMLGSKVNMKAGVIKTRDQINLKRSVFRITRNNCFVVFVNFTTIFQKIQKNNQNNQNKVVVFLLFSGIKNGILQKKIQKLLSSFSIQNYYLPENNIQLQKYKKNIQQQIIQNQHILTLSQRQLQQYLISISELIANRSFSKFQIYKLYLMKQKQIYNQLNQMQVYTNFLKGNIYVRKTDILQLHKCLKSIQSQTGHSAGQLIQAKDDHPPTFYVRNLYTDGAQQIVETYGVPQYKQANPAFFTVITFPFLFGVMFGDIAHGSILMLFGLCLMFLRTHMPQQYTKMLVPHRYMIFLMGFFSTYCGFIYNDFMSISLNLFGSCYNINAAMPDSAIIRISNQCVYPLGIDPIWAVASNNLNFVNSLKMKIAVIIGVLHMTLGILIKASNSLYFKKKLDFYFQFIPQLIFMIVLFGYMDFLIIFKWLKPWQPYDSNAPSIITTMINMPLKMGQTQNCCEGQPLWGSPGATSQNTIQLILILLALICIPLMLLPKPLIRISKLKKKEVESDDVQELVQQKVNPKQQHHEIERQQTSSQIFVDQLIETIEYVLGSISNTASYLRLWALSLAHSQLSEVFFQKTVQDGIKYGYSGIPRMFFSFFILAASTFGVLLCMDSMECFLHTLRLHWVQFQNKFYKGNGYPFIVFNFKKKISQQLKQS